MTKKKKVEKVPVKLSLKDIQILLSPFLAPLAYAYGGLMYLRRRFRMSRAFETKTICVSVGNISWGGTGKTPIVDWLAAWACKRDMSPCILARGYGGVPNHLPLHVNTRLSARQSGDEALLLAFNHPKANVIVDPIRSRAALYAMSKCKPDFFILDDGFQHLAMERHLDLVLLDPNDLSNQWNKVQPWGSWREFSSALKEASAFLIKVQKPEEWQAIKKLAEERLTQFNCPIFAFMLMAEGLVKVGDEKSGVKDKSVLANRPYMLVTGVGKPEQVFNTVKNFMGYEPLEHKIYADHFRFSFADGVALGKANIPIICTQKDAVKLRYLAVPNLYYIQVKPQFGASIGTKQRFSAWWSEWWTAQSQADLDDDAVVLPVDFTANSDIWNSERKANNLEVETLSPNDLPKIENEKSFLDIDDAPDNAQDNAQDAENNLTGYKAP